LRPSSIKYTIYLGKYSFESKLNTLQLIISTEVSSNKNDICSNKELDPSNDNNQDSLLSEDYLKISLGHLYLYGRFIKRALINNITPTLISNKMLNETMEKDSNNKANSYIAIQIPYYTESIVIDPDFSILLDNTPKSTGICSTNSSKLSTNKIIGIVLGSVGLAIVIILSTLYILYKRKQKATLQNKIKNIQMDQR
ncbi:hypothetical protein DICPUDRAFT_40318, partial [Dictyostelium purpureum]